MTVVTKAKFLFFGRGTDSVQLRGCAGRLSVRLLPFELVIYLLYTCLMGIYLLYSWLYTWLYTWLFTCYIPVSQIFNCIITTCKSGHQIWAGIILSLDVPVKVFETKINLPNNRESWSGDRISTSFCSICHRNISCIIISVRSFSRTMPYYFTQPTAVMIETNEARFIFWEKVKKCIWVMI